MIDRLQESAAKREKIAKYNEERQKRHDEGYQTPEEGDKMNKTAGKRLLMQQLKYDDEMEDQATENGRMSMDELNGPDGDADHRRIVS